ncbi:MAG: Uma2 family endonuclease [Thermoanaerobaculia bacterium]|nr:Uma2 family endonuclease [Thermoanaerobaculia bacterium]
MQAHASARPMSAEEYLESEPAAEARREYLAGQLYAMAGSSDRPNTIALTLAAELRARLKSGPSRVFITDMKVRVREADTFYYPDVFVTCDPADREPLWKEHPKAVFEVLSPTTEATDRREKLLVDRLLSSLEEYVLVSQDRRRVEVFRRAAAWQPVELAGEEVLRLESLGVELELADVYAGILQGV